MKNILDKYDLVVGLEIHVQLNTESKLFAADKNSFGDTPNSNVSPITLAHPGTLPKPNRSAISHAIKMGLACNCEIASYTTFDRKNYFYPDLPKGYQTTQDQHPICVGGYLDVKSGDDIKRIPFNRIHIEEDAGKSSHDAEHEGSLLDYNRAGTPLIEMVTEPEISSAEEAGNLLTEIRKIVRYINVGDGNMEQGSLRCDANISLKLKGSSELGKRVEIKNMNSIRNVQRAIAHEVERQAALLDAGKTVLQETRGFNDDTGKTTGQRTKEEANDYRYFPCPDLLPIHVSKEWVEEIRATLPKLPHEVLADLQENYEFNAYDAEIIADNKELADYFYETSKLCKHYKRIANWLIGPIKSYLNDSNIEIQDSVIQPKLLAEIIELVAADKVSFSMASTRVLPALIKDPNQSALDAAKQLQLLQSDDQDELIKTIEAVIASMPDKAEAYRKGKKGLLGMFMGEVMKKSGGKANPKVANKLIAEILEK
ncbi:Asp-tRNA(Asn)/Glu-tRNA(Gln) amidotransferase subunit GatB [Reichenbachiella carrageenanivorans]|uniref:Aspartyl/glutamyl-tRNA(Asn/Gln) amidotransferase subunit B n=1 Tax=Reichenbachiella carrageenanivorans TaxID=2979869 RepID=A0ABY6D637_9BACT|nr:Asp-tRNA(Asn)/Glu-tRNA(Gln) amidotransferase subunit GatB [Reichenbachiella carrageenanivorans]UXX79310.1 Asp-tRNA(Asn)/Glu-tRNA(Gln) amidotransferase subunit GatB [Reichenbachiella carrageenanivorans]